MAELPDYCLDALPETGASALLPLLLIAGLIAAAGVAALLLHKRRARGAVALMAGAVLLLGLGVGAGAPTAAQAAVPPECVAATETPDDDEGIAAPSPTTPAPTEPTPSESAPSEPGPTQPGPTEPAPSESAPSEPGPTQPGPTEPAPEPADAEIRGTVLLYNAHSPAEPQLTDEQYAALIEAAGPYIDAIEEAHNSGDTALAMELQMRLLRDVMAPLFAEWGMSVAQFFGFEPAPGWTSDVSDKPVRFVATLLGTDGNVVVNSQGQPFRAPVQDDGTYAFTNVPAGDYVVEMTVEGGGPIEFREPLENGTFDFGRVLLSGEVAETLAELGPSSPFAPHPELGEPMEGTGGHVVAIHTYESLRTQVLTVDTGGTVAGIDLYLEAGSDGIL